MSVHKDNYYILCWNIIIEYFPIYIIWNDADIDVIVLTMFAYVYDVNKVIVYMISIDKMCIK